MVPLNPLAVTLAITNASFVAQSVDWNPPHLYATLRAAHRHDGLSFVRVLQRCPHYMPNAWDELQRDPSGVLLLDHEDGIQLDPAAARPFKNREHHDPSDGNGAREIASRSDVLPIGLLYRDRAALRYDRFMARGLDMPNPDKVDAVQAALDRFLI